MEQMYIDVAETLFELEHNSIDNNREFYYDFIGWKEKYGKKIVAAIDQVIIPYHDLETLAALIKQDHQDKYWQQDENGALYSPDMCEVYAGFIEQCWERQLAFLTGSGYQLSMVF